MLPTAKMIRPITTIYTIMIARVFGTFPFCRKRTIGLSKKYKNPVIIIGTNNVENSTPTGWNKNDIFVQI